MSNATNKTVIKLRYASSDVLCSPTIIEYALKHLPYWCRQKAERLKMPQQQRLSLTASLLLEQALQQDYQLELADLPIEIGHFGKPKICGNIAPYFNLSHTGSFAFCVTAPIPVGVDAEGIMSYDLEMAQSFFEPEELFYLNKHFNSPYDFTRIWVCRESYSKMLGCGLSGIHGSYLIFEDVRVRINDCSINFAEFKHREWIAAVCWRGEPAEVHICNEPINFSFCK